MKTIVDISLLNSCNFHCSYCISKSLHAEEAPYGRYEIKGCAIDPDPLIDYIKTHFTGAIIQLSGGEPLTYLPITYVVKELLDTNTIIINTNGALIKNVPKLYDLPINWRVSVHPEQREVEVLYTDIEPIVKTNRNILLNYVLHPRHLKDDASYALNVITYMESKNIPFEITGFEGTYKDKPFRHFDPVYDGITTDLPRIIPIQFASIESDGRVYGCHANKNGNNSIGNIYDGKLNIDSTCTRNCFGPEFKSYCPSISSVIRLGLLN